MQRTKTEKSEPLLSRLSTFKTCTENKELLLAHYDEKLNEDENNEKKKYESNFARIGGQKKYYIIERFADSSLFFPACLSPTKPHIKAIYKGAFYAFLATANRLRRRNFQTFLSPASCRKLGTR